MNYNPLYHKPIYRDGKFVDYVPASWIAHHENKADNEAFRANHQAWADNARRVDVDQDGKAAPIDAYDARVVGR